MNDEAYARMALFIFAGVSIYAIYKFFDWVLS